MRVVARLLIDRAAGEGAVRRDAESGGAAHPCGFDA